MQFRHALMGESGAGRIVYISWARDCSRSDHTAREFGGTSHMVYWAGLGSRWSTVWLKYAGQSIETWRRLAADRPSAVFVMAPPVFAGLVAWIYCRLHGCALVIDAHSAAFLHARWRYFQWLQFWLCRRAVATIVHNEHLRNLIEKQGARAVVVTDIPVEFPEQDPVPLPDGFNVAVVCSFNPDEPLGAVIEAARCLPDVHFHLTGNPDGLDASLRADVPGNVTFTGFLPTPAYGSLIGNVDAVMALTTRDHTMLRAAWEAIYQGTPVIVSDWPVLRESFATGAVYVDNSPAAIVSGIERLRADQAGYRDGARELRARKHARWTEVRRFLEQLLSDGSAP